MMLRGCQICRCQNRLPEYGTSDVHPVGMLHPQGTQVVLRCWCHSEGQVEEDPGSRGVKPLSYLRLNVEQRIHWTYLNVEEDPGSPAEAVIQIHSPGKSVTPSLSRPCAPMSTAVNRYSASQAAKSKLSLPGPDGACVCMCLTSMAPTQFGKFHTHQKSQAMRVQSLAVGENTKSFFSPFQTA